MKKIRLLYLFFKSVLKSMYAFARTHYKYAVLQNSHSRCIIAPTANIVKSNLQDWVVIFDHAILYNCEIGSHTYILKSSRVFNSRIGNFCSIASNVSIAPGLHLTTGVSTHPSFYLKNTPLAVTFADRDFYESSKEVTIGHDVWIGENAIILDGVSIGTGAIIAAGSVVTKNIEPYCIAGGVPARVIKYRFAKEMITELLNTEWWDLPNSWLKQHYELMRNPSEFYYSLN